MTKLLAAFVPIFALLVCTCFAARATDTAAIKWCRELEQSDEAAQAGFAYYYHQGEHVSPDDAAAIKWCRKDAEQGNWAAQFYLALIYYHGEGVPRDYAEAMKWWRKAAAQGNADAQYYLGVIYYHGEGVPRDYAEAIMVAKGCRSRQRMGANQSRPTVNTRRSEALCRCST
jgi:TPR repeat protein